MVDKAQLVIDAVNRNVVRPKCMTCDYLDGPFLFDYVNENEASFDTPSDFYGFCRCLPPSAGIELVEDEEGMIETISYDWPQVDCDEWCGKYQPRAVKIPIK